MTVNPLLEKRKKLLRDQAQLSDLVSKLTGQIQGLKDVLELRQRELIATNGAINIVNQLISEDIPLPLPEGPMSVPSPRPRGKEEGE